MLIFGDFRVQDGHRVPLRDVGVRRLTLRKIMKRDLGLKPYKPGRIYELNERDLDAGEATCRALLRRLPILEDFPFAANEC